MNDVRICREIDTRSSYTILSVARLLNLVTPELSENAAEYLASCQTYEGGVGGEEFNEAHGGYTFCAFAAICILGKENMINKRTLLVSTKFRLIHF